ncbi:MAG TPA: ATP-binding cassette domain-containing protein [Thermoanaerobaculia bacterium]|jgi:multiple sugar transport system ATP-binding protein|nr:ATP-binding cassette domain-containing protein [Thermoanaerobaculia bacterium]
MAVVETRSLTKVFPGAESPAVDSVDLVSAEGEFLVLLGPSGSGKTTVLRMIAGLEDPTSGEIFIGGRLVNALSPRERRIAMVFQSYALYPHLTVFQNIAFPLKAQGVPKSEHRRKVEWAASIFGIERLLGRRPRELSGGERQRVALARALVREPALFLLDEPLSNLDAKLRATAREELQKFQRQIATTTVYVTHDQVEAMALGDRVVVMDRGRVRQIGTPAEVYDDPADTFVATFLGSPPMNLMEDGAVTVGFRPEHFRPADGGEREELRAPFTIEHIEYLGADRLLYGSLGGRFAGRTAFSRLPSYRSAPAVGTTLDFVVEAGGLKLFETASGKRRK